MTRLERNGGILVLVLSRFSSYRSAQSRHIDTVPPRAPLWKLSEILQYSIDTNLNHQ